MTTPGWTVLQIGAREHYAVARALQCQGLLDQLLTDCWVPPGSALARLPRARRLVGRYHHDLATARVRAPSLRSLAFELRGRLPGDACGWRHTMARNAWFQRWARRRLGGVLDSPQTLFAYSYAAGSVVELARDRGWHTILGQIDPGPEEERLVLAEHHRYSNLVSAWRPAPPQYWQSWFEELELADQIVVNSAWSRDCLARQGVPQHKLRVIPLAYERSQPSPRHQDPAPPSPSHPFQLLFLGTIGLRKGVGRLLEAMRLLQGQPVQLLLAGPSELDPLAWAGAANIRWLGPVPRSEVATLYRQSQALILPTLSDGFAITQLEALAHGCPVIASQQCGEVVTTGVNGWLLPSTEPEQIAATIIEAMETASQLLRPLPRPIFGMAELANALQRHSGQIL